MPIKVLFVYPLGNIGSNCYVTDGIVHGMASRRDIFDVYFYCVGSNHLYRNDDKNNFEKANLESNQKIVNEIEATEMISNKFFDILVFSWRTSDVWWKNRGLSPYYEEETRIRSTAFSAYPPEKIAFIDGSDDPTHGMHDPLTFDFLGKSTYFKRELYKEENSIFPIGMSFPQNASSGLIRTQEKNKLLATVIPGESETYIFKNDSESYFNDYKRSYFGMTWKKLGWDCRRHYEIIFSSCVPIFPDINECPPQTMTFFPKEICREVLERGILVEGYSRYQKCRISYSYKNIRIDETKVEKNWYNDILFRLYEHAQKFLTTRHMADYVISKMSV